MDQTPFSGTSPGPSQQRGGSTSSRKVVLIVIGTLVLAFVAMLALPVVIFLIKFGWPMIRAYFDTGIKELEEEVDKVKAVAWYLWMYART